MNQSERDSLVKARLDGDRLPANISGCLGQVRSWGLLLPLLLSGGGRELPENCTDIWPE